MSSLPDLSKFLPGEARSQLQKFFYGRMVEKGVNFRSEPMYRFNNALEDVQDQSEWVKSIASDIFDSAIEEFERLHTLEWSNELQRAWRKGINDPEGL